jgi:hypothetical protein
MTPDEQLAEAIAAKVLARLNPTPEPWDAERIANWLGITTRQAKERVTLHETFPAPMRLPGVGKRWKAEEVIEWAAKHQDRRAA